MALPASGPISSSQVATEFDVSQTSISLSNLGTKLSSPISAGQPVELANDFYGQSGTTYTAFSIFGNTSEPAGSGEAICGAGRPPVSTAYHTGNGTFPENGEDVFSDNDGSNTPLAAGYYRYQSGEDKFSFALDSAGQVSETTQCEE